MSADSRGNQRAKKEEEDEDGVSETNKKQSAWMKIEDEMMTR